MELTRVQQKGARKVVAVGALAAAHETTKDASAASHRPGEALDMTVRLYLCVSDRERDREKERESTRLCVCMYRPLTLLS